MQPSKPYWKWISELFEKKIEKEKIKTAFNTILFIFWWMFFIVSWQPIFKWEWITWVNIVIELIWIMFAMYSYNKLIDDK